MELFTCSLAARLLQLQEATNILVVYGRANSMPRKNISNTLSHASMFGNFDQIIDLTPVSDQIANSTDWNETLRYLQDYLPLFNSVDQVLVHTLWKEPEWSFLKLCPQAEIILYDNGLDSHLSRKRINPTRFHDNKPEGMGIAEEHLERVNGAFYTLGDMLPIPDFVARCKTTIPEAGQIREHLETIGKRGVFDRLATIVPEPLQDGIMLVGTSFNRTKKITISEEKRAYLDFLGSPIARSRSIVFQNHPRNPENMTIVLDGNLTRFESSLPFEFLPCIRPFTHSASISSSSLLIFKKVFSIEYTLLGMKFQDRLRLPWLDHLKKHAANFCD